MEKICLFFILFLIYSIIGWCIEVVNSFIKEKKFVNRGFLLGPYCPIYGYSAIIMIFYLEQYRDNILTVFLLAVVICTFVEYLVSYIMEKLFNARWWDYSNRKFNINGRVCLVNAFLFGILGVVLVYIINPFLLNIFTNIKANILIILVIVLNVLNYIISMFTIFKIKNKINKIKKDNTEEFNNKIKEIIDSKFLNRRIFSAFPKFKINIINIKDIKNIIEEKIEKK